MTTEIYRRLAKHLDSLPAGFPPTPDGLELRILQRLFSEEQAALAVHLTLLPESAETIAARAGFSPEKARAMLEEMAHLGLITDVRRPNRPPRFMAAQFVVGIWEYQVNRLTPELAEDVSRYLDTAWNGQLWQQRPQLRTIPIGASLEQPSEVLLYENAEKLLAERTRFAVAPCICRQEMKLLGEGCYKPMETCLVMDGGADLYLRHGRAREISREEALEILQLADRAGLVLQPGNSQDANNICCCCGDCCGILRNAKRHPQPSSVISSSYYAQGNPELCVQCYECVDRCQMDAINLDSGYAEVDLDRCIGCGLCVSTCATGALRLLKKEAPGLLPVPASDMENYTLIAQRRGIPGPLEQARQRRRAD